MIQPQLNPFGLIISFDLDRSNQKIVDGNTKSIAFEMTPPGPGLIPRVLSVIQYGILLPFGNHTCERCPVACALFAEYVEKCMPSLSKMRFWTKSGKLTPEYFSTIYAVVIYI